MSLVLLLYVLKCPISCTFVRTKSSTWPFLRQLADFVCCGLAIVVFVIIIVLSVAYHWELKWPFKIVTSLLLLFRQVFLQVQRCGIRVYDALGGLCLWLFQWNSLKYFYWQYCETFSNSTKLETVDVVDRSFYFSNDEGNGMVSVSLSGLDRSFWPKPRNMFL